MQTGLLHLHNLLRWVIILLLLVSIYRAYTGWKGNRGFTATDRKTWLFLLIASHITLVLGLYQWLAGRYGLLTYQIPDGTSWIKTKFYRFFWLEHPLLMIIAIILITLGNGMAKKQMPDGVKFQKAFWFFFTALLAIVIAVPWPFREVVARPWLP
jgi:hypothetical protein